MGTFKEMDPEVAWRLIEGYQDELTPEAKKQEAFYRQFRCQNCRTELQQEIDAKTCFRNGAILPKALLRCALCGYLIDPETRIILSSGNPAQVPEELPIIGE